MGTFAWGPLLGNLCSNRPTLSETIPCNFGNLGNIDLGTFTWGLPGTRELLLGYLGTLWDTSPRRPLLYLGICTCKPANLRKLAGSCAGTLPTFTLEPLLGKICPWLGTLTWEPCQNLFWGEPLLGQFVGTCIQGNLKNLERQTLSETVPCNVGRLGNLARTFLWKPLLGDLYLGTLTCPHRNLHFTWIPLLGNLRLGAFTWQPLLKPCQKQYPAILGTFGTLIWEPSFGNLYLGILLRNKAHSTHISPSHPSSQSNL